MPAEEQAEASLDLASSGTGLAPPPSHPTADALHHARLRQGQHSLGNQGVQRLIQRDGATLPPVPNYQLTPPSLQAPGWRRPPLLGGDQQLRLDPQIEAEMHMAQIRAALSPSIIQPQLGQLPIGPIRMPPPGPPNPITTPSPAPAPQQQQPAPQPQPRVGEAGEAPREGSAGDVLSAVTQRPEVAALLDQASDRAVMEWQRLRLGGQVGVVSISTMIAAGAVAGIAATPEARRFVFQQIDGLLLPVPKLDWLKAEFTLKDDNVMFGLHLNVGHFLNKHLGFGPGSPEAMGGPPRGEDIPGPLRRKTDG